jgi:hypothetical protein
MKPDKVIKIPINGFPCDRVSPQGLGYAKIIPHNIRF